MSGLLNFPPLGNSLGNGMDFLQMQSMMGAGGLNGFGAGGLGTTGLGGDIDFPSLLRNMVPSLFTPAYQPTATAPVQLKPEEKKKKIEELQTTTAEAEKSLATAKLELTESNEAETDLKGKEFTASDAVGSVIKGTLGMVTDLFCDKDAKGERHFSLGKTMLSVGAGAIVITATVICPPLGTALAVAGAGLSGMQIAKGLSHISNAKTHADKDAAVQEMTQGVIGGALSFMGFKAASALKAVKNAKTAETLSGATNGLTAVAVEAGKANTVTEVVKAHGLAENAELLKLVADARKAGKPISVSDLYATGITDGKQSIQLHQELNAALKAAQTAEATTQDAGVLSAINREVGFLKAAGTDAKAAKNAKEALSALLKLTTKNGITPETEAALARIKMDYPEIAKELKLLSSSRTQVALVKDMAGREQGILEGLKGIVGASEKEQAIIEKATTLLANINNKGADRAELLASLKELQRCESVGGELEISIRSARNALATTAGESLKAAGRSMVNGAFSASERVVGAAQRVVNVSNEEFLLNSRRVGTALPQAFNQLSESVRQQTQTLQFAQVEKDIKDKKEAVATATTKHDKAKRELASLYGINIKDSQGKLKSVEELNKEVIIAQAGKEAAQKVLAEAEKEKAAKAAA